MQIILYKLLRLKLYNNLIYFSKQLIPIERKIDLKKINK